MLQPFSNRMLYDFLLKKMASMPPASGGGGLDRSIHAVAKNEVTIKTEGGSTPLRVTSKQAQSMKVKAKSAFTSAYQQMFSPTESDVNPALEETAMYPQWKSNKVKDKVSVVFC